jgi:hypothetical protein
MHCRIPRQVSGVGQLHDSVASGEVQGRHSIRPGIEGRPRAKAFRAKVAEGKKAEAEVEVNDPALPADEFSKIAYPGAALETEAEPLE